VVLILDNDSYQSVVSEGLDSRCIPYGDEQLMVITYSQRTESILSDTNNHISMILDVDSDQYCLTCGAGQ
jgi:hypothetical protein